MTDVCMLHLDTQPNPILYSKPCWADKFFSVSIQDIKQTNKQKTGILNVFKLYHV